MSRPILAAGVAAGLSLALAVAAAPALAADPPGAAASPASPPAADTAAVQPQTLSALERMSDYLNTLKTFELTTHTSLDLVTAGGQLVEINGGATYKLRRPDGFVIDMNSDARSRRFIYDGKQFTVFAPELGYYATVAAPPTIRETLDTLYRKFGLALPLEDLFRWGDATDVGDDLLDSGFYAGPSTIAGVITDHYVLREGQIDWQIWIQQGDQPLPRKLVITDRADPAAPTYSAVIDWNLSPAFAADEFAFRPGKDAKSVRLTLAQ